MIWQQLNPIDTELKVLSEGLRLFIQLKFDGENINLVESISQMTTMESFSFI